MRAIFLVPDRLSGLLLSSIFIIFLFCFVLLTYLLSFIIFMFAFPKFIIHLFISFSSLISLFHFLLSSF